MGAARERLGRDPVGCQRTTFYRNIAASPCLSRRARCRPDEAPCETQFGGKSLGLIRDSRCLIPKQKPPNETEPERTPNLAILATGSGALNFASSSIRCRRADGPPDELAPSSRRIPFPGERFRGARSGA